MNILITTNINDEKYTPYVLDMYKRCLDAREFERYMSFSNPMRKQAFLIARGELKTKLAGLLNTLPHKIRFSYNEYGKPFIEETCFSISHSEDLIAIAISSRNVGVDLECMIERDYAKISKRIFRHTILDQTEFYKAWTAHEAIMKCAGLSVLSDISQIKFKYDVMHTLYGRTMLAIAYGAVK